MAFSICFWGVRGSIASPGPDTAAVGGNTSSVEVRCGAQRVLLDAGTGIRRLGESLLAEGPVRATLLLSHHHWDHIQGLPFFVPLYVPSTELTVIGPTPERVSVHDVLEHQMTSPVFPVRLDEVPCRLDTREVVPGAELLLDDVRIRVAKGNHPGGSLAYRIDYDGKSVVYATDTEHYSCVDPALERLAQGADVLIYDSQYTPHGSIAARPGLRRWAGGTPPTKRAQPWPAPPVCGSSCCSTMIPSAPTPPWQSWKRRLRASSRARWPRGKAW